jgi:hypothetical protein
VIAGNRLESAESLESLDYPRNRWESLGIDRNRKEALGGSLEACSIVAVASA